MPDYVTPVTWLAAPELLTLEEAQRLSGLSEAQLRWIVADGGIEAQETAEGLLVEKAGLSEWLDALTDLALIAEAEAKARAAAELQ